MQDQQENTLERIINAVIVHVEHQETSQRSRDILPGRLMAGGSSTDAARAATLALPRLHYPLSLHHLEDQQDVPDQSDNQLHHNQLDSGSTNEGGAWIKLGDKKAVFDRHGLLIEGQLEENPDEQLIDRAGIGRTAFGRGALDSIMQTVNEGRHLGMSFEQIRHKLITDRREEHSDMEMRARERAQQLMEALINMAGESRRVTITASSMEEAFEQLLRQGVPHKMAHKILEDYATEHNQYYNKQQLENWLEGQPELKRIASQVSLPTSFVRYPSGSQKPDESEPNSPPLSSNKSIKA